MTSQIALVKFIGCWACVILTILLLILHGPFFNLPGVLAILAIAFAQAPTNWS